MYKKSLALATSTLVLSLAAHAQPPAPAPAAANVPTPEIIQVTTAAAKELGVLDAREPNINKRIAAYDKFSFSPELRPRLKAVFGTDKPFAPQRLPDSGGRQHYQSILKAGGHAEAQAYAAWSDVILKTNTSPAGNQMNYTGEAASLTFGVVTRAQVSDLRFAGRQSRASDGLWYGAMNMSVASIAVKGAGGPLLVEDLRLKTEVQRRGKNVDLAYGLSMRSAGVGEHKIERLNIATRVLGMDGQVVADFTRFASSPQLQQLAPEAQMQVMLMKFKELGRALLRGGVTVVIDDISAAWRGQVASLKGRIGFAKGADAELDSMPALLNKLLVRLEVRVPVAAFSEYAGMMAAQAIKTEAGKDRPLTPEQLATIEKQMSGKIIGNIRQSGYAVVGKDEVSTVIEFKNGVLTLNGKGPTMLGMKDGKLALPPQATK